MSTTAVADSKAVHTPTRPSSEKDVRRIWPLAVLIVIIVVTIAWDALLIYGLFRMVRAVS
jgi:hypothetical protein